MNKNNKANNGASTQPRPIVKYRCTSQFNLCGYHALVQCSGLLKEIREDEIRAARFKAYILDQFEKNLDSVQDDLFMIKTKNKNGEDRCLFRGKDVTKCHTCDTLGGCHKILQIL